MAAERQVDEATLEGWARGPGKTEEERCANAEREVRNAIAASEKLARQDVRVFAHGSYRNRVNVRRESDVDVGVACRSVFFTQLPQGKTLADYQLVNADYGYATFKNEVGEALVAYFGASAVTRGNKAFDIKENSYHVEADVAPFFELRRYSTDGSYLTGVELRPDNGGRLINWPEQHYENGVAKNAATSRAFKGCVRILKHVNAALVEANHGSGVPGFLVECMTYNVPDSAFGADTWRERLRTVLAHQCSATTEDGTCENWVEVSRLKQLFGAHQKWTRQEANQFTVAAWSVLGLSR